jgi:hypothetical protein
VHVKYTDYDDAEWQDVKFMIAELGQKYFDTLVDNMHK